MRYITAVLAAAAVALLVSTAPAQAAWTGDVTASEAKLTGDGALDLLQIGTNGAYLSHSYAGPGFSSDIDWNGSPAVTELVPLAAQLRVVIEGGGGDDLLRIGDDTLSATAVPFPFYFRGGDGTDSLIVDASKDTGNRFVDVGADSLSAGIGFDNTEAGFNSQSAENTVVLLGKGADTIQVYGTNAALPVSLDGGDGNDTARVGTAGAGIGALRGEFAFSGSNGDDSLVVSDAASTTGSVTDIDTGGLHRGGGTARPTAGTEHVSFTAGSGADSIAKSSGLPWTIDAGPGDDSISTRDAFADRVACGAGADFEISDPLDALGADCERSDRDGTSSGSGGTGTGGGTAGDGGAAGGGAAGGQIEPDTKAPVISVAGLSRKPVRVKALLRGLRPKLSADEPARFDVQLLGSARRVSLARAYDLTLAKAALPVGTGARAVKLKPKRRTIGRARRFSVRLIVTATDASGNRSTVTRTLKVKR